MGVSIALILAKRLGLEVLGLVIVRSLYGDANCRGAVPLPCSTFNKEILGLRWKSKSTISLFVASFLSS
jgi:hypothetical protein